MSIYTEILKDGKACYRMPYKCPLTGKTKRVSVVYDKDTVRNRRRAEEYLQDQIDNILLDVDLDIEVSKVLESYFKEKEGNIKESTMKRNKGALTRLTALLPEGTRIRSVKSTVWKDILTKKSKNKPGTYNEYLKRLKSFLVWAYDNEYLKSKESFEKLKAKPTVSAHKKVTDKYLEQDEAISLINGMEGMDQWQLLTKFLILSGLRIGEAMALERDDIYNGFIHVTKTYNSTIDKVTPPKTVDSVRDVSIQKELSVVIRDILKYNGEMSLLYKCRNKLLFPNFKHNSYMHYDSYRQYLIDTSKRVLGRKVTPHVLRHTSASMMLAADISIEMISRRLGHADSKVTKEIYLHIMEERKKKDADRVIDIKMLG